MPRKPGADTGNQNGSNVKRYQALEEVRQRIDEVDSQLAPLLAERLELAKKVADVKAELNLSIKDSGRESDVLNKVARASEENAISHAIRDVYSLIFEHSRQIQRRSTGSRIAEPLYFPQITIIGLGLIGGVMARLVKERVSQTRIVALDIDTKSLQDAAELGVIDQVETDLAKAVNNSALIILAASPDANLELIEKLAPLLKKRQILIDVTSAKSAIVAASAQIKSGAEFIGGHPLFGSEKTGFAAGANVIADGAVFCLSPASKSSEISLRRLMRWLTLLGLKVDVIEAGTHDRILANTSHLVQLLIVALGAQISDLAGECGSERVFSLCGPAFKQLARLMNSSSNLWWQISRQNQTEISEALRSLSQALLSISESIASGDKTALEQAFVKSREVAEGLAELERKSR